MALSPPSSSGLNGISITDTPSAGEVLTADSALAASWQTSAGATDGWTPDSATWTRTADQTFTVTGDRTAVFSKGTRLKWTQTTVKYGTVVASSHAGGTTTVTIATTSDYVLTAAALSATYFSYATNPQGYPSAFTWVPAWTSSGSAPAIGDGTLTGFFSIVGRWCTANCILLIGAGSTVGTGTYSLSLPVTGVFNAVTLGDGRFTDASTGNMYTVTPFLATATTMQFALTNPAPSTFYGQAVPVNAAASDHLQVNLSMLF